MFLDARAVVAVLLSEPQAPALMKTIEAARGTLRFLRVVQLESTFALVPVRIQAQGKGSAAAENFAKAGELADSFSQQ